MTTTTVHLEDVARAARHGVALSLAGSLLALMAMLAVGLSPLLAALGAVVLLAVGCASGGFGLVARVSLRAPRLPHRRNSDGVASVPPIHVPQPR